MALYSALQPVIEANQWHKNGDHPDDHVINNINSGRVIKRHPTYNNGNATSLMECNRCGKAIGLHGILDKVMGDLKSQTVCPGDYIETVRDLKGRTVGYTLWKQKSFELHYSINPEG